MFDSYLQILTERYRPVLRGHQFLLVEGEIQQKENVINILLQRAASLSHILAKSTA